jgi:hypothetical protein
MRVRRLVRVTHYRLVAGAGSAVHVLRRAAAPRRWARSSPFRIHWVDPHDVMATTAERLDEHLRGRRIGGDWDVTALPLTELALWHALEQHLQHGVPWERTELPSRSEPEAPNVGRRLVDADAVALKERQDAIDALAASMRRDGWLPHHDVGASFLREMAVVIGRDGRLIRNRGGLHRLMIAQLLDLDRIPCRILAVHEGHPDDGGR